MFSALDWKLHTGSWNLTSQVYWRQHHDRFELFRSFQGAENFPGIKTTTTTRLTLRVEKATVSYLKLGKSSLGADICNEHIYSTVLGA